MNTYAGNYCCLYSTGSSSSAGGGEGTVRGSGCRGGDGACMSDVQTCMHAYSAAVCCGVLQCVAVCSVVLRCVAVCCCVMQCVAVCCTTHLFTATGV